ncbi:MAG: efflux RND transporter permease subunit [Rhizobiales bacterium]|nr:efflux RND transporter permease subunit [Hyphomicrobiales bacterium]
MARIILDASLDIRSSIVYATLIIVFAVLPVFFLTGLSGSFFKPLAQAYVFAILTSLVVAMTVTPALSMILLSKANLQKKGSPLVTWLHKHYTKVLTKIVDKPRNAYVAILILGVFGAATFPLLGQQLLHRLKNAIF